MMASGVPSDENTLLLHKLCQEITKLNKEKVSPYYQHALLILGSHTSSTEVLDEFKVAEKIKRKLSRSGRERDVICFSDLHRRLQNQALLKNRARILQLLLLLADEGTKPNQLQQSSFGGALFRSGRIHAPYATSTPFHPAHPLPHPEGSTQAMTGNTILQISGQTSASSGISSGISSILSRQSRSTNTSAPPSAYIPSLGATPAWANADVHTQRDTTLGPPPSVGRRLLNLHSSASKKPSRTHYEPPTHVKFVLTNSINALTEISESDLLRDLVYVLQGIETKWVKFDRASDRYILDVQVGLPKSIHQLVSRVAELGWLYRRTSQYVQSRQTDKAFGLVGQSFCAALNQELTEYYRLIAVLEAQLSRECDHGLDEQADGLTLRRLLVWTFDPLVRLKFLAALVDACKGKKGGSLVSCIYSYLQHGDPYMRSLIKHILNMVSQPICLTLIRWLYEGDLEDTYHDFFVASDPTVRNERMWQDKYSLRKSMIPSFISMDQARRILLTGKSINFLRQVCQDKTVLQGREAAVHMDMTQGAEAMLTQDTNTAFQTLLDDVYRNTSQHLLQVLYTKYKFMDHLKAMRRYLLLGQGDFVRHLMDLLEEDLGKPATHLFLHNLTGILESAVRATNAQYDDADILKRLDVRMLEVSPGDAGWDVFSLAYHVDGPIRTVFTPECIVMYLRVFNFLWRAKRMDYILALLWKNQLSARLAQDIPELADLFHTCHMVTDEMVHFVQQIQYYINFEVLECSWDALLTKLKEAGDLDYIIAAHQVFLDTIISRCLLDEQSKPIQTQLRAIFDLIIQFQNAQDAFYSAATQEVQARQHFIKRQKQKSAMGNWGITEQEEEAEQQRRLDFLKGIKPSTRPQLRVITNSYQDMVQEFLSLLMCNDDQNLRFLSFHLDFNEHYKRRSPKARASMNFRRN